MFYTVYRIINNINGKIYIGKHQTKKLNDGYMGSGKYLKRAIAKYGIENFSKDILFLFDNEYDMNLKEAELVTEDFCLREDTYNICSGGKGGFGYINKNGLNPVNDGSERHKARMRRAGLNTISKLHEKHKDPVFHEQWRQSLIGRVPTIGTSGKKFSEEIKAKMSESGSGKNNSQFGTMWITNGQENKKIKKIDVIPEGWHNGRKIDKPQVVQSVEHMPEEHSVGGSIPPLGTI